MRVLIVEDDAATATRMELCLRSEGIQPFTTDLGEEAIDLARRYDYDLITLDIDLPDMSGLDVLRTIRAAKLRTPVIMASSQNDIDTKVRAFALGADDYLTKPFHSEELLARIHAVTRRAAGLAESAITIGDLTIHLDRKAASVRGRPVHLTGREYQMLELMALRRGVTLTKEAFMNHLYGGMDEPEIKVVDVFICKIRKKLRDAGAGEPIRTAWGRGYFIKADEREAVEAAA